MRQEYSSSALYYKINNHIMIIFVTKTFYIPVHFYEQDETDDELVMVITQRDIGDAELKNRLTTIKNWYMRKQAEDSDYSEYNEKEIVDAIFDELADELNGTWCYCSTMPRLVIGDP